MKNVKFAEDLIEKGYVVLKQCISQSVIAEHKQAITFRLGQLLEEKNIIPKRDIYLDFLEAIKHYRQFQVQVDLAKYVSYKELHKKKFLEPLVLEKLIFALGSDLECAMEGEFNVNVMEVTDDYLVKKSHQEFWSGCGLNTLQTWTPIAIEEGMGGIEVIEGSHTWGHVPHRNREPIEMPSNVIYKQIDADEGDMVIFHSLLLHQTVPNRHEHPRFAMPQHVRSFHDRDTGFEDLKIWEAFHYSPLSQIRKRLGNPHLSPFRTYGSERNLYFRQ